MHFEVISKLIRILSKQIIYIFISVSRFYPIITIWNYNYITVLNILINCSFPADAIPSIVTIDSLLVLQDSILSTRYLRCRTLFQSSNKIYS
ncbi:CRPV-267 [Crowpox virus]|nr:CRPV-267 [Crowpox virus]